MKRSLFSLITAVLSLILATAFALAFIHISGQPYKTDIDSLGLVESSGFSREELLENYNAVMDFLSPFSNKPFDLPSMEYSESGASHFEDCKPIFNFVYLAGLFAAIILALLVKRKAFDRYTFRSSGVLALAIPAFVGTTAIINFDKAFVLFHKVFFRNDDWLFDPSTDEIITALPAEYFMHCAVYIGVSCLAAAAVLLLHGQLRKDD